MATTYDMLHYICPPDGRSVRLSSDEHCRAVQAPDGWVDFLKNKHKEEFYVTNDYIGRGADSSLISSDGVHPVGTFYVLYTLDGAYGTNWCKRLMRVGDVFHRDVLVVIYDHTGKERTRGRHITDLRVKQHLPSKTFPSGVTVQDVLVLEWGGEEVYYYARGVGLCGWENLQTRVFNFAVAFDVPTQAPFPLPVVRPSVPFPKPVGGTPVPAWDNHNWGSRHDNAVARVNSVINIRAEPFEGSTDVGDLHDGDVLTYFDNPYASTQGGRYLWYKVIIGGAERYVAQVSLLRFEDAVMPPEVVTLPVERFVALVNAVQTLDTLHAEQTDALAMIRSILAEVDPATPGDADHG